MTTRLKGFTVALEMDIREDDAETIKSAIESLRHVLSATPIETVPDDWINRQRIRLELSGKLWKALHEEEEV